MTPARLLYLLGVGLGLVYIVWFALVAPQDVPPLVIALVGVLALFISSGLNRDTCGEEEPRTGGEPGTVDGGVDHRRPPPPAHPASGE